MSNYAEMMFPMRGRYSECGQLYIVLVEQKGEIKKKKKKTSAKAAAGVLPDFG